MLLSDSDVKPIEEKRDVDFIEEQYSTVVHEDNSLMMADKVVFTDLQHG